MGTQQIERMLFGVHREKPGEWRVKKNSLPDRTIRTSRLTRPSGHLVLLFAACLVGCFPDRPEGEILTSQTAIALQQSDEEEIIAIVATWFPLSDDGLRFEDPNCGDVAATIEAVDLNNDGSEEMFVQWGNTCTSGATGRSLALFTKEEAGDFRQHFGFPAVSWTALKIRQQGWPDIQFNGPGFCQAVWGWASTGYAFKCNQADAPGGCEGRRDICD